MRSTVTRSRWWDWRGWRLALYWLDRNPGFLPVQVELCRREKQPEGHYPQYRWRSVLRLGEAKSRGMFIVTHRVVGTPKKLKGLWALEPAQDVVHFVSPELLRDLNYSPEAMKRVRERYAGKIIDTSLYGEVTLNEGEPGGEG